MAIEQAKFEFRVCQDDAAAFGIGRRLA